MKRAAPDDLALGPDVLQFLLPHRRPFLMVDRIEKFGLTPRPYIRAQRLITANEPVFAGHFPDWHIWPGAYTFEGLAQCCNVLSVLQAIEAAVVDQGQPAGAGREALLNLERGYRLDPGFRPDEVSALSELRRRPNTLIGFTAAADLKWLAPVMAGDRLDYRVEETHRLDDMLRFSVEAEVAGRLVVKGTLTSKAGVAFPWPQEPA